MINSPFSKADPIAKQSGPQVITRDALGHLALTDRGRAVSRAMLPDL
jgi:hypothetical protein